MSAPASSRGSDSIPSGAERLTQASPIPASAVLLDAPADLVVARPDLVRRLPLR